MRLQPDSVLTKVGLGWERGHHMTFHDFCDKIKKILSGVRRNLFLDNMAP